MIAGCSIRLSTPPKLSASENNRVRSSIRFVSANPAFNSTVTMPPKPFICRRASSCCGWLSSPG
jgi:hypothetical protein